MLISSLCSRFSSPSRARGFTLIELLVVMAIIMIITGFILLRQSSFNSSTLLRSLGYSVALSLRQAQVYGTSVYGTTTMVGSSPVYAQGYGITLLSGDATHYFLFADLDNNGRRTGSSEDVKVFALGKGYTLSTACVLYSGAVYCTSICPAKLPFGVSGCFPSSVANIDIFFRRPNPDACIDDGQNFCAPGGAQPLQGAYIQIQSADGSSRSITVSLSGQIVVGAVGT